MAVWISIFGAEKNQQRKEANGNSCSYNGLTVRDMDDDRAIFVFCFLSKKYYRKVKET